ncbi:MAG: energy transducer TonB [Neisseria sp.]|uniref:energy transducer TonB n=1 Tax=Neisseria sp. TaxID=192066 RepID=UPI0026DDA38B|nr:energy transducer TonB [Neisseria sp.]MDO4641244.1 energy transducer TonB [Neisseria sp.]
MNKRNEQGYIHQVATLATIAMAIGFFYLGYQMLTSNPEIKGTQRYLSQITEEAGKNLRSAIPSEDGRKVIYTGDKNAPRMELYSGKIQPVYPQIALKNGYEGFVTYKVDLDKYGLKESIKIAQTSGYESLDTAALKAIESSVFTPPNLLVAEPSTLFITCGFQNRLASCLY